MCRRCKCGRLPPSQQRVDHELMEATMTLARSSTAVLCLRFVAMASLAFCAAACGRGARPGQVLDEAQRAGRDVASMTFADEDYFRSMDGGIALTPDEIKGRNMWIVWTGGNDRFWDTISHTSFGTLDF